MDWVFPVIGALIIATIKDIFKKHALTKIEPIQFLIIFHSFMFIFANAAISKISIPSPQELLLVAFASLSYGLASLFGLRILKEIEISLFKPIWGLTPALVLFFAMFILNESITLLKFAGVLLVMIPVSYLIIKETLHKGLTKKIILYSAMGMFFEAAAVITDRIALRTLSSLTYFYFLKLFLIILLAIALCLFHNSRLNLKLLKEQSAQIALFALITMTGTLLYFVSMSDPSANTGIIRVVLSSSLVFTTITGGVYFKEKNLVFKAGVAVVSLIGVILLIIN